MTSSVLITNYNYARHLPAAVSSALRQTRPAVEVVVVDDGSTDGSREVLEEVAVAYPGRVTVVFQANAGQAAAINAGFGRCTGDVVCMMDADDVWDEAKLDRVVQAHAASPDAAMVMHRTRLIDAEGHVTQADDGPTRVGGDLGALTVQTGGAWVFGATSSLSFTRRALERILPIPTGTWRLCADGALAYAAAFLGKTVSLEDVLGSYRIHGRNNHAGVQADGNRVQADIDMTNQYLNDFLARIGRPERVDLARNLSYRRDRFYRRGGGPLEPLAIARLITTWPLYDGPIERARFLARFIGRSLAGRLGARR